MADASDVVASYWAAIENRNWAALGRLLAADVVFEVPQSRERVRGRDACVRFNAEFPGDWHLRVERIVADDAAAASWIVFSLGDNSQPGISFFELDEDGLIRTITDFWPDPYEPPPGREHLVERY